jgi:hypothetical protein
VTQTKQPPINPERFRIELRPARVDFIVHAVGGKHMRAFRVTAPSIRRSLDVFRLKPSGATARTGGKATIETPPLLSGLCGRLRLHIAYKPDEVLRDQTADGASRVNSGEDLSVRSERERRRLQVSRIVVCEGAGGC